MTDQGLTDKFTITSPEHPNYHSNKLQQVFESPEFQEEGWKIDMSAYRILGTAILHTNIELINPQGEMVTTLDLWSLNQKDGSATFYDDDEVLAPVLDDNKGDNLVVIDFFETERVTLTQGSGPEILIPFSKMIEFAAHTESLDDEGKDFLYKKFPDADDPTRSNSNGQAFALAQFAGLEVPQELIEGTGLDSRMTFIPGKDDNLVSKIWPKGQESQYAQY